MISCVADAVVVIDSWLCEVWQWWVYKYHVESFIFIIIINYNKIIILYIAFEWLVVTMKTL